MLRNNKGVTLVELLIVIVVMGIIAAFAIPAVGNIISNTQKDAIVADAIAVENAAQLYCSSNTCASNEALSWADLKDFVDGVDGTYYEFDSVASAGDVTGDVTIATLTSGEWVINLQAYNTANNDWDSATPSTMADAQARRDNVDAE